MEEIKIELTLKVETEDKKRAEDLIISWVLNNLPTYYSDGEIRIDRISI